LPICEPISSAQNAKLSDAAWFYPAAGALLLWEVDLWRGREESPTQDFLLACLFDGFERELLGIFPESILEQ
jgi:hypothetical protein